MEMSKEMMESMMKAMMETMMKGGVAAAPVKEEKKATKKSYTVIAEIGRTVVTEKLSYITQVVQEESSKQVFYKLWKNYKKEGESEWCYGKDGVFIKVESLDVINSLIDNLTKAKAIFEKLPKMASATSTSTTTKKDAKKPVNTTKVGDSDMIITPELMAQVISLMNPQPKKNTTKKSK